MLGIPIGFIAYFSTKMRIISFHCGCEIMNIIIFKNYLCVQSLWSPPLFQVRGHEQEVIPEAKGQIPAYCVLTVPHCQTHYLHREAAIS